MWPTGLTVLLGTTASVAILHTAIGVDHVVPFLALGRAQRWSLRRTLWITTLCGIGHVGVSVLLAFGAIALGVALQRVEALDALRGDVAAWGLIGFGFVYAVYGLWRGLTSHPHPGHHHGPAAATVWALFILFALGPCETLIPLMLAPALSGDWLSTGLVVGVFSVFTIGTMVSLVAVGSLGVERLSRLVSLERWSHAAAGLAMSLSGLAIVVFGV